MKTSDKFIGLFSSLGFLNVSRSPGGFGGGLCPAFAAAGALALAVWELSGGFDESESSGFSRRKLKLLQVRKGIF